MITIDWSDRIINIPKADLTLVQSTPTEIRELPLNWFRMQLKDIEDSEAGIVNPRTHNHNTEVSLGGLTYARIIEIINGYTITFEDGQYAVNLTGANSNVGDVTNVNQVSVRSQNSAGMTSSPAIEYASFDGAVWLDVIRGVAGTLYPIGSALQPVSNLQDAKLIAEYRGIKKLAVIGAATIDNIDLDGYMFAGTNAVLSELTLGEPAGLAQCVIVDATINGTLDGGTMIERCLIKGINFFNGIIYRSAFSQTPVKLGGTHEALFLNCYSAVAGGNARPCIDFDGGTTPLAIRGWMGGIELINKTNVVGEASVDMSSGTIYIRSSCTAGEITVRGIGKLVDESGAGCVVKSEGLLDPNVVSALTFGGHIHIDVINGGTGTLFPMGNESNPVNNMSDALAISATTNIATFHVLGALSLIGGVDVSYKNFVSSSSSFNSVTVVDAVTEHTTFKDLKVSGAMAGSVRYTTCVIGAITGWDGGAKNCLLTGDIDIIGNGANYLTDVDKYMVQNSPVTININGNYLNMIRCRGKFALAKKTGTSLCSVDLVAGSIIIEPSCVAGTIAIGGIADVEDNSMGTVVIHRELSSEVISDSVWDKAIEAGYTAEQVMKIIASVLAGKASGAGSGTITFRDITDHASRVVSQVDGTGNRLAVTLNV